jgi:O-antigen/teichoic acid export membrane protein
MTSSFKRTLVRNAVSNYIRTAVAMVVGLVTFRLLYQHFNQEEFGFWSLLWSVFGYGILLDFGFGFAAQKRVAELSVKQDWAEMSRVLSSILVFYIGIAFVVALSVLFASPWLIQWFGVSAERAEEFRMVMVVFFVGIGLSFPMGIFPEILRGQQRISLANNIITLAILSRLILIILAIWLKWSFLTIMLIALGSALAPDAIAGFFALQRLPHVRLRPSLFAYSSMSETVKFSVFAYLGTATNLVLAKTDQIVITTTLGVAAIALYQAGAKVGEMFRDFTKQVQDTLSPAAAHLHADGNHIALRELLVQGTRWSVMIATPLYLLCAFYLDELLQLLTGDRSLSPETWLVGQVLLFWYYTTILTHSVSKRVLMMTGHERRLMWLGVGEAIANLVISIGLVLFWKNVAAVAIGSLIPTLWFGWAHLWPWMARESGESAFGLLRKAVFPAWVASFPALAVLIGLKCVVLAPSENVAAAMFIEGALVGFIGLLGVWRFGLKDHERSHLAGRFRRQPQPPALPA